MIVYLKSYNCGENPRAVVVNVLDCNIVVSEFELKSCYYIHFRTNSLKKDKDSITSAIMR